jgi:hypothetical protein
MGTCRSLLSPAAHVSNEALRRRKSLPTSTAPIPLTSPRSISAGVGDNDTIKLAGLMNPSLVSQPPQDDSRRRPGRSQSIESEPRYCKKRGPRTLSQVRLKGRSYGSAREQILYVPKRILTRKTRYKRCTSSFSPSSSGGHIGSGKFRAAGAPARTRSR